VYPECGEVSLGIYPFPDARIRPITSVRATKL
jgi:hypothetical protein